jgi:NADH:ubiquinone oxidoreductase subunit H
LAVLSILYFNIINYAFLINILSAIIFILIGGILPLYERKKLSLIQRRVGPKFVGLDGRLQFIVDAIKIFLKEYIFIFFTNKYYFLLLPIITLIVNLFFLINFQ